MRAHSRSVSEITDILEAIVVGKALEIAIVREVGDSVLYHSSSVIQRFCDTDTIE